MKSVNKKGFTLVELMAVVIVLIVVIFIAVTRINKTTKNARNKAIIANAGSYIKAVNNYLSVEGINSEYLENLSLTLSQVKRSVKVNGTKPDSGNFDIQHFEVVKACLEYDGFKVNYENGNLSDVTKGKCDEKSLNYFAYTGSEQKYVVPVTGIYKIELWGAGGGQAKATFGANLDHAGYGAYTSGEIELKSGDILYFYVGKKGDQAITGSSSKSAPSYNGGGAGAGSSDNDDAGGSGGGATDVRLVNGNWDNIRSLSSRIMVAAGGAGAPVIGKAGSYHGGHGGALSSAGSFYRWENSLATDANYRATQTTGNAFGKGQDAILGIGCAGSGAGGGYWGGTVQTVTNVCGTHGGGGSSYISGHTGSVAVMTESSSTPKSGCSDGTTDILCSIHYSNKVFTNTTMIPGNEYMPSYEDDSLMRGNSNNGYARISFVGDKTDKEKVFEYAGPSQYVVPKTGNYKLEVWGAQGASKAGKIAGFGGYSVGTISLNQGDILYVNVGGQPDDSASGGYNGGGGHSNYSGGGTCSSGGGATHIATKSGVLSTLASYQDSILIVAGGGAGLDTTYDTKGASGGGYIGNSSDTSSYGTAIGGSQTAGGIAGNASASNGSFGQGGQQTSVSSSGGGGGGGFYGGAGGHGSGGGGGSGYIGNSLLTNKEMYCYNCAESDDEDTKTISTTCADSKPKKNCAKKGSGYARITLID